MTWHTVSQGECLASIARARGFAEASALLDHPENADLKRLRPSANVLHPGDRVFIPDLEPKEIACASGRGHRFQVRMPGVWLRVHLKDHEGRAHTDKRYRLEVDGAVLEGTTDGAGLVEQRVPAEAQTATLSLWLRDAEAPSMAWALKIGHLDPADEVSGAQARLENLGFHPGAIDGRLGPETTSALTAFQRKHGLDATGELDEATRAKLVDAHAGT